MQIYFFDLNVINSQRVPDASFGVINMLDSLRSWFYTIKGTFISESIPLRVKTAIWGSTYTSGKLANSKALASPQPSSTLRTCLYGLHGILSHSFIVLWIFFFVQWLLLIHAFRQRRTHIPCVFKPYGYELWACERLPVPLRRWALLRHAACFGAYSLEILLELQEVRHCATAITSIDFKLFRKLITGKDYFGGFGAADCGGEGSGWNVAFGFGDACAVLQGIQILLIVADAIGVVNWLISFSSSVIIGERWIVIHRASTADDPSLVLSATPPLLVDSQHFLGREACLPRSASTEVGIVDGRSSVPVLGGVQRLGWHGVLVLQHVEVGEVTVGLAPTHSHFWLSVRDSWEFSIFSHESVHFFPNVLSKHSELVLSCLIYAFISHLCYYLHQFKRQEYLESLEEILKSKHCTNDVWTCAIFLQRPVLWWLQHYLLQCLKAHNIL